MSNSPPRFPSVKNKIEIDYIFNKDYNSSSNLQFKLNKNPSTGQMKSRKLKSKIKKNRNSITPSDQQKQQYTPSINNILTLKNIDNTLSFQSIENIKLKIEQMLNRNSFKQNLSNIHVNIDAVYLQGQLLKNIDYIYYRFRQGKENNLEDIVNNQIEKIYKKEIAIKKCQQTENLVQNMLSERIQNLQRKLLIGKGFNYKQ